MRGKAKTYEEISNHLDRLVDLSVSMGWQTRAESYTFLMLSYDHREGDNFWLYVDVKQFKKYQELLKTGKSRITLDEYMLEIIRNGPKSLQDVEIRFAEGLGDKNSNRYII